MGNCYLEVGARAGGFRGRSFSAMGTERSVALLKCTTSRRGWAEGIGLRLPSQASVKLHQAQRNIRRRLVRRRGGVDSPILEGAEAKTPPGTHPVGRDPAASPLI